MQLLSTLAETIPPALPGIGGKAFTAYQLLATAASYGSETKDDTRVQYSKFATRANSNSKKISTSAAESLNTWPSQIGMLAIYTPAFLASTVLLALGTPELFGSQPFVQDLPLTIPQPSPAAIMCFVHFAKRVLEVLFLHQYSGRVDKATPSFVGLYYMVVAILIGYASTATPSPLALQVGLPLFAVGIAGNFFHHCLLANLRKSGAAAGATEEKRYVAPRGGGFEYVAAPHYFFELVGWLGMAVVSGHLNVFLVFTSMTSYLSGRSVAQNDFNRKKFSPDEWPESRNNLIPFVF